jgi:hypothetical protein
MKKNPSKEVLAKEAAFWAQQGKAVNDNPGKICHK